jgi:hypothetical protein
MIIIFSGCFQRKFVISQQMNYSRTRLKNRILVQDRGAAEFLTGGLLLYVED